MKEALDVIATDAKGKKYGQYYYILHKDSEGGQFKSGVKVSLDRTPRCLHKDPYTTVPTVRVLLTEVHGPEDTALRVMVLKRLVEAIAEVPSLGERHLYYENAFESEKKAVEELFPFFKEHPYNKHSYISQVPCGAFSPSTE